MDQFLGLITDHAVSIGLSFVFLVVIYALRYLVLRTLVARLHDAESAFRARKISFYVALGILLFTLAWIWTQNLANAGSFIGLLSAGIAIALSDVLKNIAGSVFILLRRPFKVGDRIEVGPHAGDVIDIGLFRFSILEIRNWVDADQTTGRILHIPNGVLFVEPLANFTEGFSFVWHEIPVTVTFESDWDATTEMVRQVIRRYAVDPEEAGVPDDPKRAANQYFALFRDLTPAVYVEVAEFGVTVTGRLLVEPQRRRPVTSKIWQDLFKAIDMAPGVTLAYPTTRFFRADREGSRPDGEAKHMEISSGGGRSSV